MRGNEKPRRFQRGIGWQPRLGEASPEVYIVISNGAFLSPWWLQLVDAVWMIHAGDAAKGAGRSGELTYRDAAYFQLASATTNHTQFPLNSIFNHEPKKTSTGEDADVFRRYHKSPNWFAVRRGTFYPAPKATKHCVVL